MAVDTHYIYISMQIARSTTQLHAKARRFRRTEKHSNDTDGGGLAPSAANPELRDLVPRSEPYRTTCASCRPANVKAAHCSICCAKSRPIALRLSTLERQRRPAAWVIELRCKSQTVNACKLNDRPAQTARQGNVGARASAPGAIGRSGRCRQTSARRTQTSGICNPPAEAGASARAPSIGQRTKRCFWLIYLVDDPSTARRIVSRLPW